MEFTRPLSKHLVFLRTTPRQSGPQISLVARYRPSLRARDPQKSQAVHFQFCDTAKHRGVALVLGNPCSLARLYSYFKF